MNIFLSTLGDNPKVKIGDFGLACKVDKHGMQKGVPKRLGTVGFMSPQVVDGIAITQKADVWSLGVILFALISSQVPF